MKVPLIIRLGPHGARYSSYPPREDIKLLGTVQEGQAIGALAQRADGRYVQLNGDFERVLNTSRVQAVLQRLQGRSYAKPQRPTATMAPVVLVKRRRALLPQADRLT